MVLEGEEIGAKKKFSLITESGSCFNKYCNLYASIIFKWSEVKPRLGGVGKSLPKPPNHNNS